MRNAETLAELLMSLKKKKKAKIIKTKIRIFMFFKCK